MSPVKNVSLEIHHVFETDDRRQLVLHKKECIAQQRYDNWYIYCEKGILSTKDASMPRSSYFRCRSELCHTG